MMRFLVYRMRYDAFGTDILLPVEAQHSGSNEGRPGTATSRSRRPIFPREPRFCNCIRDPLCVCNLLSFLSRLRSLVA